MRSSARSLPCRVRRKRGSYRGAGQGSCCPGSGRCAGERAPNSALENEKVLLEKIVPQSSVEVTKKVEAARRMKRASANSTPHRLTLTGRRSAPTVCRVEDISGPGLGRFRGGRCGNQQGQSGRRGTVFKTNFAAVSYFGATRGGRKRTTRIFKSSFQEFHGLADISPQPVLSESERNGHRHRALSCRRINVRRDAQIYRAR